MSSVSVDNSSQTNARHQVAQQSLRKPHAPHSQVGQQKTSGQERSQQNPPASINYNPPDTTRDVPSFTEQFAAKSSSYRSSPLNARRVVVTLIFIVTMLFFIFLILLP